MTYCVGIKINDGLVALADGRITAGTQVTAARKLSFHGPGPRRFMIMTAGLRSVRDKSIAYLERQMRERAPGGFRSMLDAVNGFAECLRRVSAEDKKALEESKLSFDLNAIIGGQLEEDPEPTLFQVYPEGNWIEVDERTPYLSIGSTAYGKPILDRSLRPDTPMNTALKIAYLSFDSTRVSSTTVGFPVDLVTMSTRDHSWREINFEHDDLREERQWWNSHLTRLVDEMPDGPWLETLVPDRPRGSVVKLNRE